MPQPEIKISDEDIAYAENILFGKAGDFDGERKVFIQNLETIDLQAVPGSGKTTALLAKLLILERHLPFEDGSGILVISHTNAAIDEIKNRIGQYCPKLFSYPNYIGTIQAFVDQFLALPFYYSYMNGNISIVDQDIYQDQIWKRFQDIYWNKAAGEPGKWLWGRHAKTAQQQTKIKSQISDICNQLIEREVKGWYFDYGDKILKTKNDRSTVLKDPANAKYIAIRDMFDSLIIEDGIVSFDYMYHFAELYIQKCPIIKYFLQRRFRFVFVDEMQDMDKHQHDLLEYLYFDNGQSLSIYQRIGDKNQAIFSEDIEYDGIWKDRAKVFPIAGSRRLSPSIAKAAQPFGLIPQDIRGNNSTNADGLANNIPPHIIVYDDNSAKNVIPKFCELVKKFENEGRIPKVKKYPITAIAWRKGSDGQFGLKNYWPEYEANTSRSKADYPNLKSYLLFAKTENSQNNLDSIHKSILKAFLRVLRLEQIKNPDSRTGYFSIGSLQKYLKDRHTSLYDDFQLRIFYWCRDVYLGKTDDTFTDIKQFIPKFLNCFGKTLGRSVNFANDESIENAPKSSDKSQKNAKKDNIYRCKKTGIEVEIGTVHSVKGETHTATLYLESYYYKDGKGKNAKSYESQRLKDQFAGKKIPDGAGDRTRQSARMVYVGFSRPTHLLCFAVHKDRYDENIFPKNGWEVKPLYDPKADEQQI
jgi:superfamily I DNA/RNA helicase